MEKVTLYKYGESLEHLEEQIVQQIGIERIFNETVNNVNLRIYKEEKYYNDDDLIDTRMEFLEEPLLYAEKIFLILIIIPRDDDGHDIYWVRRGGKKYFIDKYKNINYPLYYLANISDYEKYTLIEKTEKTFDLFSGERNLTSESEISENVETYFKQIDQFSTLVEKLYMNVKYDSQIGRDLKLMNNEKIRFANGIEIFINVEDKEEFLNIIEIVKNIRKRNGKRTLRRFFKLYKKVCDIDFNLVGDYSGLFIIKNQEAINNEKNFQMLRESDLNEGKCNKKLIGFYDIGDEKYYISLDQKIYNIKLEKIELSDLISSENKILRYLNVEKYASENNYIEQISNINNDQLLVHVFHKNHYYKNTKSKYEICDVLICDKKRNEKYLIFIKYKYQMSSSEVFWQSSFVFKEFEKGNIKEEELKVLLNKVDFPKEYQNIDFFQNFKYVNLILPEKDNVNTKNLTHIINLWKNDEMAQVMEVIIPETIDEGGETKIINLQN